VSEQGDLDGAVFPQDAKAQFAASWGGRLNAAGPTEDVPKAQLRDSDSDPARPISVPIG
jgi:hypothetical protein